MRLIAKKIKDFGHGLATHRRKTYRAKRGRQAAVWLISLLLIASSFMPAATHADIFSSILASLTKSGFPKEAALSSGNVQTLPLPQPALNIDPSPARGGGDVTIVDDTALLPAEGPSGTIADIERPKNATISVYVVREGDTLSGVAKLFGISPNTILWANDLPRGSKLKVGQTLTILPVTGVKYTAKPGDTLQSVAKKFGGDAGEIASFNGIDGALSSGTEIIIPDGEVSFPSSHAASSGTHHTNRRGSAEPAHDIGPMGDASEIAYYIAPLAHYTRSQGIHGYNAVDLRDPVGTPILAAASGEVIVARAGGWNGGYGNYVVIQHDNGSQTLYGHASEIIVGDGEHVVQGQVIGYVGSTGKSTGPHLHFEIRNGIRNPF